MKRKIMCKVGWRWRKPNNIVSKYGWSYETIICLGRNRTGLCFLASMYTELLDMNGVSLGGGFSLRIVHFSCQPCGVITSALR